MGEAWISLEEAQAVRLGLGMFKGCEGGGLFGFGLAVALHRHSEVLQLFFWAGETCRPRESFRTPILKQEVETLGQVLSLVQVMTPGSLSVSVP